MANVIRSPVAEAVLRAYFRQAGLAREVEVRSAGTHAFRQGEPCETQVREVALERGFDLSAHRACKLGWQDLEHFELILAMDTVTLNGLRRMATEEQQSRIRLYLSFVPDYAEEDIPDPFLTLGMNVPKMLDLIELGARGIVEAIVGSLHRESPAVEKSPVPAPRTIHPVSPLRIIPVDMEALVD